MKYDFDREDVWEAVSEFVGPLIGMVVMMVFVTGTYSFFIHDRFDQLAVAVAADIHDPNVSVKLIGHTLILEGTARDQSERDRCEAIAADSIAAQKAEFSFFVPKVLNLITIKKSSDKQASIEAAYLSALGFFGDLSRLRNAIDHFAGRLLDLL